MNVRTTTSTTAAAFATTAATFSAPVHRHAERGHAPNKLHPHPRRGEYQHKQRHGAMSHGTPLTVLLVGHFDPTCTHITTVGQRACILSILSCRYKWGFNSLAPTCTLTMATEEQQHLIFFVVILITNLDLPRSHKVNTAWSDRFTVRDDHE